MVLRKRTFLPRLPTPSALRHLTERRCDDYKGKCATPQCQVVGLNGFRECAGKVICERVSSIPRKIYIRSVGVNSYPWVRSYFRVSPELVFPIRFSSTHGNPVVLNNSQRGGKYCIGLPTPITATWIRNRACFEVVFSCVSNFFGCSPALPESWSPHWPLWP